MNEQHHTSAHGITFERKKPESFPPVEFSTSQNHRTTSINQRREHNAAARREINRPK